MRERRKKKKKWAAEPRTADNKGSEYRSFSGADSKGLFSRVSPQVAAAFRPEFRQVLLRTEMSPTSASGETLDVIIWEV